MTLADLLEREHPGLNFWLRHGARGVSSEAIVTNLTALVVGQQRSDDHPHDPSDFVRCEKLLRAVPTLRPRLLEMRHLSVEWARLVARWDEVAGTVAAEVPGVFDGPLFAWRAPRTYALMREIISRTDTT